MYGKKKQSKLNQTPSEEKTLQKRGYKLISELGEGSYAKVFLGEFTGGSSRPETYKLACKVIDASKSAQDFLFRFLPRELNILAKINHPHIIQVHSIFQRQSKYFVFMRHAERGDLLEFILNNDYVSENQARVWARQIALALQYLHELEIAHRDLKCENILVTENYNVKLSDFGFARFTVDDNNSQILSKTYCGSLAYVAPEVLRGKPYHPKKADMWSLGVVLFTVMNKSMPFDDSNAKQLYECQMKKKYKFHTRFENVGSENSKSIIKRLLLPDLSQRLNINDVVNHPWMGMDPRLMVMSPQERAAYSSAVEESKKRSEVKKGGTNCLKKQCSAEKIGSSSNPEQEEKSEGENEKKPIKWWKEIQETSSFAKSISQQHSKSGLLGKR